MHLTFSSHLSLSFITEKCNGALGMESGFIANQQLSAHSAWNDNHARYGASRARLYLNDWPQGWSAQKNDPSPWLQVDLQLVRTVTAVATQGYGNEKEKEWVKTYVLMTSRDGERWNAYKEGGRKRVRRRQLKWKMFFCCCWYVSVCHVCAKDQCQNN